MKRVYPSVVAASLALGLLGWGQAAQAEEWKFALEEITGSVQDAYAQKFKELVEQKTDGDVSVTIYPYGSLGTSSELTELVSSGILQLANASPGHLGTLVPETQVFSVPYLLSQNEDINKQVLTESETIYGPLAEKLANQNLQLLTMYPEGEQVWTTNKEIRKPADFEGFKMRVMTSPMLTSAYQAFGANPTPLPYSEVYGALQLKMIDGQVNPIFAIEEMKFYEVQDYLIFAGQQIFTTTVVANNDWYQGLSDEHRQALDASISEAADHIFEVQKQYNAERLEKIKEAKPDIQIIRLSDEEREPFREAAQTLRDLFVEMTGDEGKQILEGISQEIQQAEQASGG